MCAHADSCGSWFAKLNISVNDPDCQIKCAIGPTDMGTFYCPSECGRLCKPKAKSKPCKLDIFWEQRLTSKATPFSHLISGQLQAVKDSLSKMPKSLRPKKLKAIVKASGPDITSIASSAASSDEYLILFPRAFLNKEELPRTIFHELVHFMVESEWKKQFEAYKTTSGWNSLHQGKSYRKGDFVDSDGKFSPEEDFTNNVEYYVFAPDQLKQKSPKLFEWIKNNLKSSIKLEKGCHNAN